MSPSHTPGPWHVGAHGEIGTDESCIAIPCDKVREHIIIARSVSSKIGWRERNANTRLIAAAPDLLAALEALLHIAVWDDDYTTEEEFAPVAETARAAIVKAKGKQP